MRPLTIIVTSLAVASTAAFSGYWLGQTRASRASAAPSSVASASPLEPADGNAKLDEKIALLNRRLTALELTQVQGEQGQPPPGNPPPAVPAVTGESNHLDPASVRERESARVAKIEAALKTETKDTVWASGTESQLQAAVDTAVKEGAQFSVKTVKCLTSLCEMVLSASSPDQLSHTALQLGSYISGMSSYDVGQPEAAADGSATVTYRLFRKGYPRPDEGT